MLKALFAHSAVVTEGNSGEPNSGLLLGVPYKRFPTRRGVCEALSGHAWGADTLLAQAMHAPGRSLVVGV